VAQGGVGDFYSHFAFLWRGNDDVADFERLVRAGRECRFARDFFGRHYLWRALSLPPIVDDGVKR
jgi:hypothetical protein